MGPRLISLGLTTIGGGATTVELAHQVVGHRRRPKRQAGGDAALSRSHLSQTRFSDFGEIVRLPSGDYLVILMV